MSAMTVDRAFEINGSLVEAWMVFNGLIAGPPPSFRDFSLADAHEATALIAGRPPERIPGGTQRFCYVNDSYLDRLYTWGMMQGLQR